MSAEQLEIPVAPSYAPFFLRMRGALETLLHRRRTREWGRKYPRDVVCSCCFGRFTTKGIARHGRKCLARYEKSATPSP